MLSAALEPGDVRRSRLSRVELRQSPVTGEERNAECTRNTEVLKRNRRQRCAQLPKCCHAYPPQVTVRVSIGQVGVNSATNSALRRSATNHRAHLVRESNVFVTRSRRDERYALRIYGVELVCH